MEITKQTTASSYSKSTPANTGFTEEAAQRNAAAKNCKVIHANDFTLQLDIDNDADFEFFKKQIVILKDNVSYIPSSYRVCPSAGGNRHVTISLNESLPLEKRSMLQAFLGSDRRREMLSYLGTLPRQERPVLLFRPAGAEDVYEEIGTGNKKSHDSYA